MGAEKKYQTGEDAALPPKDNEGTFKKSKKRVIILVVAVIILLVAAVVVGVVLGIHLKDKKDEKEEEESPTPQLKALSIKSSGYIMGTATTLTIKYVGPPETTSDWIGNRMNGAKWRTAGRKMVDPTNKSTFASTVDVELRNMRFLDFRLWSNDFIVNMRLNLTTLETADEQSIPVLEMDIFKLKDSYMASTDSDLNITVTANISVSFLVDNYGADTFFSALNTSVDPPVPFEIFEDDIGGSLENRTATTSEIILSLKYKYIQYGGILSVSFTSKDSKSDMLETLYYGREIRIFAPGSKDVIPKNKFGLFEFSNLTVIIPPRYTLTCPAMGNPRPEVSILKLTEGGEMEKMETEAVVLGKFTNVQVLTLSADKPNVTEGRYICRATNGQRTIDKATDAVVLVPAVFDEAMTGVTNTSSNISITCKASGKPRPKLELSLYYQYGPDLASSGWYKVSRSQPDNTTSILTVSILSSDSDIHTVYCYGKQGDHELFKMLDVFPDKVYNHDLEERLRNATTV